MRSSVAISSNFSKAEQSIQFLSTAICREACKSLFWVDHRCIEMIISNRSGTRNAFGLEWTVRLGTFGSRQFVFNPPQRRKVLIMEDITIRLAANEYAALMRALEAALGESRLEARRTHLSPEYRELVLAEEALAGGLAGEASRAGNLLTQRLAMHFPRIAEQAMVAIARLVGRVRDRRCCLGTAATHSCYFRPINRFTVVSVRAAVESARSKI